LTFLNADWRDFESTPASAEYKEIKRQIKEIAKEARKDNATQA